MTALRAVPQSGRTTTPRRRAGWLVALALAAIGTPAVAQPAARDELPSQTAPRAVAPLPPVSPASLERIKRALALDQSERQDKGALEFRDDILLRDERPAAEPLPGLRLIAGVDYDQFSRIRPATPGALPGHWDMVAAMTPREAREAGSADVLGIATAAAFGAAAFTLVPAIIKTVGGWFDGDDIGGPTAPPVLSQGDATIALAGVATSEAVIDADISQRGRTVALSLTVRDDTAPADARALGENFVRLVKTMAAAGPTPGDELGTGGFDYVIQVRTSGDALLARGGKSTSDRALHW